MIFFQSLTRDELAQTLLPLSRDEKQARYRSKQLYHWVYQRFVTDYDQMTDISKELRAWLKENVTIFRLTEKVRQQSLDGTCKFLWNLSDTKTIESVVIPAALQVNSEQLHGVESDEDLESETWKRLTACISSQVGCAMACKFCLTGIQGLDRHLGTHEIVAQVHELRRLAPITNIVFMGMGEPLHNLENVIKACQIFLDDDGMNFSKRKITISTSGLVPAIEELGRRADVMLAISLNSSNDEQRSKIMPVNKKWNIEALMDACKKYPTGTHRKITFEYVMLKDFNDTLEDADRVLKMLRGVRAKVNLIPFNEHSGAEFKRPEDSKVRAFQKYLLDREMTTTIRISKGRDISAACGQLRSLFGTAKGTEKHKDYAPVPTAALPLSTAASVLPATATSTQ